MSLMVSLVFVSFMMSTIMLGSLVLGGGGGYLGSLSMSLVMGSVECLFLLDFYSMIFFAVSTFVILSILLFSQWYMGEEPSVGKFISFLVLFLGFMMLLVFSSNLLFLMIGWEGVGIMSFLLISWWWGRSEASQSSVQAIIYNRVSDFSLYMSLFLLIFSGGSLVLSGGDEISVGLGILILVGAMAKSSQFLFHPWLPNAMEGPTPVSALLHSSTMVVASVFLLIRMGSVVSSELGLLVGSLTMLYSSLCAFGQTDMKKVVAFSTTSQLGLMLCSLSMGFYGLAFFHLCMHAFFKSLIFISSSVFIHSIVSGLQDIRGGSLVSGFSYLCLVVGSMSLSGGPFLSSFYSKDLILENMYGPIFNRLVVIILLVASIITVAYSLKLIQAVSAQWWGGSLYSSLISSVEGSVSVWFMIRLVLLSVVSSVLSVSFFGLVTEEYLPTALKILPLLVMGGSVVLGVLWGGDFSLTFFNLSILMSSYNPLVHRILTNYVLNLVGKGLEVFEYFWWELVYGSFLMSLSSITTRVGMSMVSVGVRSYFFWAVLVIVMGSILVMVGGF